MNGNAWDRRLAAMGEPPRIEPMVARDLDRARKHDLPQLAGLDAPTASATRRHRLGRGTVVTAASRNRRGRRHP
jgi:hypothetical protein